MRFSILIPVYNVEKYIKECLDSVDRQTFLDYEVIIVNDGSTDNSKKVCEEYSKSHNNVTIISKENEGLLSARYIGIKEAKGDFLIFLDSDDYLENIALEEIDKNIRNNNADLIIYNAYILNKGKRKIFYNNLFPTKIIENKSAIYDILLTSYSLNSVCLKVVRKEIIDTNDNNYRIKGLNYGEDLILSSSFIKNAKAINYLNKCLYNYRIESGMIRKYNSQYYHIYKENHKRLLNSLANENIEDIKTKSAFHLLLGAYQSISQIQYSNNYNKSDLESIRNDNVFLESYKCVYNSKLKDLLNTKEKIALHLLTKKKYYLLYIMYRIKHLVIRG